MTDVKRRSFRLILFSAAALVLGGCASMMSSAASGLADNLNAAVLNMDDPETAKAALPSYMVLLDGLLEGSPEDPKLLSAASSMYASYGAVFVDDEQRASRLTTRARRYALSAICNAYDAACSWAGAEYDDFVDSLDGVSSRQVDLLYAYGFASLAYLRAHSSDWNSLAELPQIEALFNHYLEIAGDDINASVYTYMGILHTLRPPALGGQPELARAFFEKAIDASGGKDLGAKVEYARGYAKLLYERELHDRLLNEVLASDPYADGYTLTNVMAQAQAETLLAEADEYF